MGAKLKMNEMHTKQMTAQDFKDLIFDYSIPWFGAPRTEIYVLNS